MIPTIDPNVRHVGTSYLRTLNSEKLRGLEGAIVVRDNEEPLVVIVAYQTFIDLQEKALNYDADEKPRPHTSFCELSPGHFGVCRKLDQREQGDGKR